MSMPSLQTLYFQYVDVHVEYTEEVQPRNAAAFGIEGGILHSCIIFIGPLAVYLHELNKQQKVRKVM